MLNEPVAGPRAGKWGLLMIILGVVALTYQGITYTTMEKAIDIELLQITAERTHTISLLPILGAYHPKGEVWQVWRGFEAFAGVGSDKIGNADAAFP